MVFDVNIVKMHCKLRQKHWTFQRIQRYKTYFILQCSFLKQNSWDVINHYIVHGVFIGTYA